MPRSSQPILGRVTRVFVHLFERVLPHPFVLAVILTIVAAALALVFAPEAAPGAVLSAWSGGLTSIASFAFQMVLVLVTGHALSSSPPVAAALARLAAIPRTPRGAVSLTVLVSGLASLVNWGFGLVVGGLFARAVARRVRLDFGWLVAAAYTGFVVSAGGFSGSIALAQATPGSALNLVEKATGHVLPLRETVLAPFNVVPVIALLAILPLLFRALEPPPEETVAVDPARLAHEDTAAAPAPRPPSFATALDHAAALNALLAAAGLGAVGYGWRRSGITLDLDKVILVFTSLGLLFHRTPIAYARAIGGAARVAGPLILQYPLYGGLMGIMTKTGLAGVISGAFVAVATARTLPLWSYACSLLLTLFVPSGGGHWAVQGPFVVPAAVTLKASLPAATMAVVMGEEAANMIQPFWALPVLAIAGIGMERVMGYMVVTFVTALVVYGAALAILVPMGG